MHFELSLESRTKVEDMLEQLSICCDMEDLTPADLVDALIDLGADLLLVEESAMPQAKARLVDYCGKKMAAG